MAQTHPLLLSTPVVALSFATLVARSDPPASGLVTPTGAASEAPASPNRKSDGVTGSPLETASSAPIPGRPMAAANTELAARVSAALTGSLGSGKGVGQTRKGAASSPGRDPVAGPSARGAAANVDWVCGAWAELWQGSGRGRDCKWAPRW